MCLGTYQVGQPQPCSCGARDGRWCVEEVAVTTRFHTGPDHHRDGHGRHKHSLGPEEILEPVRRYEKQRELEQPVQKVRHQPLACRTRGSWEMVG